MRRDRLGTVQCRVCQFVIGHKTRGTPAVGLVRLLSCSFVQSVNVLLINTWYRSLPREHQNEFVLLLVQLSDLDSFIAMLGFGTLSHHDT